MSFPDTIAVRVKRAVSNGLILPNSVGLKAFRAAADRIFYSRRLLTVTPAVMPGLQTPILTVGLRYGPATVTVQIPADAWSVT